MSDEQPRQRFESPLCPVCHQEHGTPKAVCVERDTKTITYGCTACAHEWQERTPNRERLFGLSSR